MSRSFLRHTSLRDHDLAAPTEHPQRTLSVSLSVLASRLRLRRSYTMYVNDEHYCLTLIPENSQNDDLQLEVSAVNGIDSSRSRESKILVSHDVVPLEKRYLPIHASHARRRRERCVHRGLGRGWRAKP